MPSPRFLKTEGEPRIMADVTRTWKQPGARLDLAPFAILNNPRGMKAAKSTPRLNSHFYNTLIIRYLSNLLLKITVDSDGFQTPRNPQQKFFTVMLIHYVSILNKTYNLSRGVLRALACRHVFCHLNAGLSVTRISAHKHA